VIKPGRESLEEELDELGTLAVARLTSLAVHEARALLAELTLGGNLRFRGLLRQSDFHWHATPIDSLYVDHCYPYTTSIGEPCALKKSELVMPMP